MVLIVLYVNIKLYKGKGITMHFLILDQIDKLILFIIKLFIDNSVVILTYILKEIVPIILAASLTLFTSIFFFNKERRLAQEERLLDRKKELVDEFKNSFIQASSSFSALINEMNKFTLSTNVYLSPGNNKSFSIAKLNLIDSLVNYNRSLSSESVSMEITLELMKAFNDNNTSSLQSIENFFADLCIDTLNVINSSKEFSHPILLNNHLRREFDRLKTKFDDFNPNEVFIYGTKRYLSDIY